MNAKELTEQLDNRFGNPLGPKQFELIKTAIALLRHQEQVIETLRNKS